MHNSSLRHCRVGPGTATSGAATRRGSAVGPILGGGSSGARVVAARPRACPVALAHLRGSDGLTRGGDGSPARRW